MLRIFLKIGLMAAFTSVAAYGQQSLGDIAREYREKQAAQDVGGAHPKMFTNKDLPANPNGSDASEATQPPSRSDTVARSNDEPFEHHFANRQFGNQRYPEQQRYTDQHLADQHFADQRAAEQWRMRIQMQENRVASLQARVDQISAMTRSTGSTAQYEGPYNRYQARQMERIAEMQQLLDEQKRQLDQMQDAARRAGMHTTVYDP